MQSHSLFIKTSREEKPQPARREAAASTGYKLTTYSPLPLPLPTAPSPHSVLQAPPHPSRRLLVPAASLFLAQPCRNSLSLSLPSLLACSFFSSLLFLVICAFVFVALRCVVAFVLLGDFGMALTCRTPFTLHSNSEKFYSIRILKFSICCCCYCRGCGCGWGARILRSKNLSKSSLWVIVSVIVFCLRRRRLRRRLRRLPRRHSSRAGLRNRNAWWMLMRRSYGQ